MCASPCACTEWRGIPCACVRRGGLGSVVCARACARVRTCVQRGNLSTCARAAASAAVDL